MKKRLLMVVPILALLASCGESDPMDAVSKSLPDDVVVVNPSEDPGAFEEYVTDAFDELLNISEEKAVYHLSVDFSLSISQVVEKVTYGGSTRIKGDLYLGYETVTEGKEAYSSLFLKLDDLTLSSHLNLPEDVKAKMPIPEDFSISGVDLFMYATELENSTFVYLDLSNHDLQDYVRTELLLNQMKEEDVESMLDLLLGEKVEGVGYRPGLACVDVSNMLNQINDYRVAKGEEAIDENEIKHPITALLSFLKEYVADFENEFDAFVQEFLPMVSPVVGIKQTEIGKDVYGLDKTSIAINIRSSDIASALEIPPEYMPINGVAGLLVSVGMDKGSEDYALEEINLSANLSGVIEETSFSFNGSLVLSAVYNEQAELEELSDLEMQEYIDSTQYVTSLILSLM